MAYQIIQQPDGRFAIWSTKTDSLIHWNLSEDGLEGQMAEDAKWYAKNRVREFLAALKRGERPHWLLEVSWETAKLTIPKEDRDKIRSTENSPGNPR